MAEEHSSVREGFIAGLLGATTIAIWFLILDVVAGHALYTPDLLGRGLISVLGKPPAMPDTMITHVLAYTLFHYVVFVLVGVIIAWLVHQSARTPAVLAGLLLMFVIFELGAYMVTALFTQSPFG